MGSEMCIRDRCSPFHWYVGLFFCISFTAAKIIGLVKDDNNILMLFIWTIGLYIVLFGLCAFPYMIVSFVQRLEGNTLLHFVIFFFVLEELNKLLGRTLLKS